MNSSSIEKAREKLEKQREALRGKINNYTWLSVGIAVTTGGVFCFVNQFSFVGLLGVVAFPLLAYVIVKRKWTEHFLPNNQLNQSILAYEPETAGEYAQRANIFAELEMFDEAIEDYETALKLEPDDEDTMYDYAYMLWRQKKDGAAALPWVEKIAKIENDNQGEALCMKGEILGQTDLQAGLKWIDKALEIDNDTDWAVAKVRLLLQHEALDTVDETIDAAAKQEDWESPESTDLRGQLAMKRSEYKKAAQFFTQAIKLGRDAEEKAEMLTRRAEAYDALGNMDEADADRRQAEKLRK